MSSLDRTTCKNIDGDINVICVRVTNDVIKISKSVLHFIEFANNNIELEAEA